MTFLEFKSAVRAQIADLEPNESFAYSVLADYVKSRIVREVDHDISLFRSYQSDYLRNRMRLLGFQFTDTTTNIRLAVRERLTVDSDREGVQDFINHQIDAGLQDIQSLNDFVTSKISACILDLQTYIPQFRVGHETSYTDLDVVHEVNASRFRFPDQAELSDIFYIRYYPELTNDTEYEAGDFVVSNDRLYKVIVGGVFSVEPGSGSESEGEELDGGLISEDDSETEELGGLTFQFFSDKTCCRWKMYHYPWGRRFDLVYGSKCDTCPVCDETFTNCSCASGTFTCTDNCGNPIDEDDVIIGTESPPFFYSIDEQGSTAYVYPRLDEDHKITIFWNGIRIDWDDADIVPMGDAAIQTVAEYVRSYLFSHALDDERSAQAAMQKYVVLRSNLYLDNKNRRRTRFLPS